MFTISLIGRGCAKRRLGVIAFMAIAVGAIADDRSDDVRPHLLTSDQSEIPCLGSSDVPLDAHIPTANDVIRVVGGKLRLSRDQASAPVWTVSLPAGANSPELIGVAH